MGLNSYSFSILLVFVVSELNKKFQKKLVFQSLIRVKVIVSHVLISLSAGSSSYEILCPPHCFKVLLLLQDPTPPGKFFSISLWLLREDVYHVVKAFSMIGECVNAEAKLYTQVLMRDFEHNGLNLTLTKREEMQCVRVQIDELSLRDIQNLH